MGPIPEMEVTTFGPIVRLPTGLLNESSVNEIKGGGTKNKDGDNREGSKGGYRTCSSNLRPA